MKFIGVFFLLVITLPFSFALGISVIFMPWLAFICVLCYLAQRAWRLTLRRRVR